MVMVFIPAATLVVLVIIGKPLPSFDLLQLVQFVEVVNLVEHVAGVGCVRLQIDQWHPTTADLMLCSNRPLKIVRQ